MPGTVSWCWEWAVNKVPSLMELYPPGEYVLWAVQPVSAWGDVEYCWGAGRDPGGVTVQLRSQDRYSQGVHIWEEVWVKWESKPCDSGKSVPGCATAHVEVLKQGPACVHTCLRVPTCCLLRTPFLASSTSAAYLFGCSFIDSCLLSL